MRTYVGDQEAFTASEFAELAYGFGADEPLLGFIRELLFGCSGESDSARAARLEAARDILAELGTEAPGLAAYAATLLGTVPLASRRLTVRRPEWLERAA